ncbi:hypothetical protein PanWU01x14_361780, partial [Parasponia andersonii]
ITTTNRATLDEIAPNFYEIHHRPLGDHKGANQPRHLSLFSKLDFLISRAPL